MIQPKYSLLYLTSRGSNHQENTSDGLQIDFCPGNHHNISSYSETIDAGATTYSYTKESTSIDTGMVHVTISFDNVTATPNGIKVKYPDGNISQATHSDLLTLPFLPFKARLVHLFDTLSLGSLLSIGKLYNIRCTSYLNNRKIYIFF